MVVLSHHGGMKTRLQVQLDPEDYRALKAWANAYGVSMSAAVRMLIRERLLDSGARQEAAERFLAVAGSLHERPGEDAVSRDHDRLLYGDG